MPPSWPRSAITLKRWTPTARCGWSWSAARAPPSARAWTSRRWRRGAAPRAPIPRTGSSRCSAAWSARAIPPSPWCMAMPSPAAASSPSTATCAWPPTWPASGCRSRASASSSPSGSGRSSWKSLGPPTRGTCSSPASRSPARAGRHRRPRRSRRGHRACPPERRRERGPPRHARETPARVPGRISRLDERARPPLVEDVGAPLLVVGAVSEGGGREAAGLVEAAGTGIALEGVETDGRRQLRDSPLQQDGADALADPLREEVELVDPTPAGPARHGEQPHHLAPDEGDRGASRGNQTPANPSMDLLVGVSKRRARDELPPRAQIDASDGLGVVWRGRPTFKRQGRAPPHHRQISRCRIRPSSTTGYCMYFTSER